MISLLDEDDVLGDYYNVVLVAMCACAHAKSNANESYVTFRRSCVFRLTFHVRQTLEVQLPN